MTKSLYICTKLSMHYLYRHIRLDKNEPFYIGIGTIQRNRSRFKNEKIVYRRAYDNRKRNNIWNKIVSKTEYEIEIMIESENYDYIKKKEIEFIKLYGRKNNNTGILANLTDGGEGCKGKITTELARANMSRAQKGKKQNPLRRKQSINVLEKIWDNLMIKCYQYDLKGNFVKEWKSMTEAGKSLSGKQSGGRSISNACKGMKKQKDRESTYHKAYNSYWSLEKLDYYKPEVKSRKWSKEKVEKVKNLRREKSKSIIMTNLRTKEEIIYSSIAEVLDNFNFDFSSVVKCCKNKYSKKNLNYYKGYKFQYVN